jgi:hypothetical protein
MPQNKKISDLATDTSLSLSDYVPVVDPGSNQTKKATLASILSLSGSSGSGGIANAVFQSNFQVNLPQNDTGIPNGTLINAGDSISTFLQSAFRRASHPVYIAPTVSLSGISAPAQVEVGTSINIMFTANYNQNNGGAELSRSINKNSSPLTPNSSGVYSDSIIAALSPVNYQATVSYTDGPVLNDSLGTPDATGQILAGSAISNILSYQGSYRVFFGATDTGVNPGNLRSLLSSVFLTGSVIDFPTGSTYRNFYIAVPPGYSLQTFVDFTSSSASLMGSVGSSPITIADAGAGTLNYTLYKLTTGAPYTGSGDLFKFNIA